MGGNATAINSGTNNTTGAVGIFANTNGGGNATPVNSGTNITTGGAVGIQVQTDGGGLVGNATAINSGSNSGGIQAATIAGGDATVINSGTEIGDITVTSVSGNATLTNVVGGRVIGAISLSGATGNTVNFQGGNGCSPSALQADPPRSIPAVRRLSCRARLRPARRSRCSIQRPLRLPIAR
jgi:hypothetical protein